jgi:hypothetical protein
MTKSTVTIPSIEMTREEADKLWVDATQGKLKDRGIVRWDTNDGRNEILFEGENCYRVVIITDEFKASSKE